MKKHIEVEEETKREFDKLQADLKYKGIVRTKDELVTLLMNYFKKIGLKNRKEDKKKNGRRTKTK